MKRKSARRSLRVLVSGLLLALLCVTAALAQTTLVPPAIDSTWPGDSVITGFWDPRCEDVTLVAVDQDGNIIGSGVIQDDGSFVIVLTRPLVAGDVITLEGECGPNTLITVLPPVPIPEPATLLLLGSGLATLTGYVTLRRRRR